MDEDVYGISVQIARPDLPSVMLRLSWPDEPNWAAVMGETERLAMQALAISNSLARQAEEEARA